MALSDVDAEIAEIERQLAQAEEKKAALLKDQQKRSCPVPEIPKPTGAYRSASSFSEEELERRIKELQMELSAEQDALSSLPPQIPKRRSTKVEVEKDSPLKAPQRRSTRISGESNEDFQIPFVDIDDDSAPQQPVRRTTLEVPPAEAPQDPIRARTAQNHSWEKPAWAIPTECIPDDKAILSESINNNLKKPNTGGYERKVFEKDLAIVKGTFKKPSGDKKPDPRLVWVVANLNGSKIGKIVMHLHGNADAIVDKFLELKGLEIKKRAGKNGTQLYIDDIQPTFYIHYGKPAAFTGNVATEVFGVVQEGQDIVEQLLQADGDSVLTVKQAHIYPVKKTRMN